VIRLISVIIMIGEGSPQAIEAMVSRGMKAGYIAHTISDSLPSNLWYHEERSMDRFI